MIDFLSEEKIDADIIDEIIKYRNKYTVSDEMKKRIPIPRFHYYGKDIWVQALTAMISGKNLLLVGNKSTGKNVLSEDLACVFMRPCWNISFHINMDAASLIGTDTFKNGEVTFRPGPIYLCAINGGFGILDEINMAKNEALAVLHSVLDFRHIIDVPGYERIVLHPATRFIATMNHGYAGTRELNEALLSRFVIIHMPQITPDMLEKLISSEFPDMIPKYTKEFSMIFDDLQRKCKNNEISENCMDIRGLLDAIALIKCGLDGDKALEMGIVAKSFSTYEQALIRDVIASRLPKGMTRSKIFEK